MTFEIAKERYHRLFFSMIESRFWQFNNMWTKEDLHQELLLVLHNALQAYDEKNQSSATFSTYLWRACANRLNAITDLKGERRLTKLQHIDESTVIGSFIEPTMTSSEAYKNDTTYKLIVDFINELPRGDITYAIVVEGKKGAHVAKELGISHQRVAAVHNRNLKKLQKYMEDIL